MTKRIFRAVFLVSALALAVGLAFLMVVLYQFFGGQLETELKNEASYLSIAVENDGAKALEELPEREQQVLLLRYYKNLTQIQCARVLGVSQVQISRLERRAVDRLRKILCEEEAF